MHFKKQKISFGCWQQIPDIFANKILRKLGKVNFDY